MGTPLGPKYILYSYMELWERLLAVRVSGVACNGSRMLTAASLPHIQLKRV